MSDRMAVMNGGRWNRWVRRKRFINGRALNLSRRFWAR